MCVFLFCLWQSFTTVVFCTYVTCGSVFSRLPLSLSRARSLSLSLSHTHAQHYSAHPTASGIQQYDAEAGFVLMLDFILGTF